MLAPGKMGGCTSGTQRTAGKEMTLLCSFPVADFSGILKASLLTSPYPQPRVTFPQERRYGNKCTSHKSCNQPYTVLEGGMCAELSYSGSLHVTYGHDW